GAFLWRHRVRQNAHFKRYR
ncbi:chromosomal replication initiation protein, partial [Helicobacter pylori]